MLAVLNATFPVFALILAGWLAARRNLLGPAGGDVLNRFVIYLALPALLFHAMTQVRPDQLAHGGYVLSLLIGFMVPFAIAYCVKRPPGTRRTDVAIEALANAYANAGFMGIPLCLVVLGPDSLAPAIIATLMTACVLFGITITLIEFDQHQGQHPVRTVLKTGRALLRNPLLISPLLGLAWASSGLPLPLALDRFIVLLGDAASPCALVAIGLFLAQAGAGGAPSTVARIVFAKLVVQPVVTAILVLLVFDTPPVWAWTAIIMSALPIGTGPFMLAQMYHRDAQSSSRAILISTVISVLTISALIALVQHQGLLRS
ncbi:MULTISPECIES: AEC family transporter [unclassified Achromobacter]|uniref:AEC family transporter n=1 Tax=unclassified Achromobacter TaxID=2626865 RepID=UPI000B51D02A|nr:MULTISPECIES: AEC family transporter [unclassified Achromobacter]OWT67975.1 transporter [Achromobacter sp. HZ28]OWT81034.1 transporter [Achromobacter sp. HZ34]